MQTKESHHAYLLIGGNMGNRLQHLATASAHIVATCGAIVQASSIYQTAAWGLTAQPDFYNQALQVQTHLSATALMEQLLTIEALMGRVRSVKMGPRIIDLDILLIDDLVMRTDLLQLPHPRMTERKFVLLPLAEIAPTLLHPVENKTISALLQACTDTLNVQKITPETI